jgi:hypothetical protein
MRRMAVALPMIAFVLTACSSPVDRYPQAQPSEASATASTTSPPATTRGLPTAANASDFSTCFDGECEIAVSEPVDIPLDGHLVVAKVSVVAIHSDGVDLRAVTPSGFVADLLSQRPDQGGPSKMNQLGLGVVAISRGTAVLDFSPRTS